MLKLKRSECAVLPLVLKGKWYDKIASGEKHEEYRAITPYWTVRLAKWTGEPTAKRNCSPQFSPALIGRAIDLAAELLEAGNG